MSLIWILDSHSFGLFKAWSAVADLHIFQIILISMYGRVSALTHSLTQHGSDNTIEDWVMNFGVQIGLEILTPTKMGLEINRGHFRF